MPGSKLQWSVWTRQTVVLGVCSCFASFRDKDGQALPLPRPAANSFAGDVMSKDSPVRSC